MDSKLEKAAQFANILAVLPGVYCAYGTYVLLHGGVPATATQSGGATVTPTINPTALIVCFLLFLLLFGFSGVVNLLRTFHKAKSGADATNTETAPNLIIRSAVYGAGPGSDIDITESLKNKVRDGLVIPVDNNLVPYDPAPGVRKRIVVEYSYRDGIVCCAYGRESIQGDIVRLSLPEDSERKQLKNENSALKKRVSELTDKLMEAAKLLDARNK